MGAIFAILTAFTYLTLIHPFFQFLIYRRVSRCVPMPRADGLLSFFQGPLAHVQGGAAAVWCDYSRYDVATPRRLRPSIL